MNRQVLIVNGPNLNMLGSREPEIYGSETLSDIELRVRSHAKMLGFDIEFFQSNDEGALVSRIQQARDTAGVIVNAGAYTHTSVALLDALLLLSCPVIEVHLSNIFRREDFRHHSHVSRAATGIICGFGGEGYILALSALQSLLDKR